MTSLDPRRRLLSLLHRGEPTPWPSFWQSLRRKHGSLAAYLQRALEARSSGLPVDPYPHLYASLDLYLDTIPQFLAHTRDYLASFSRLALAPSRLLDVGCGGGLLTCAHAADFPQAQVVGVDRCLQAIDVARQLASRLTLTNVSFVHADLLKPGDLPPEPFDLVTSFHVAHELLPPFTPDAFLLRQTRRRRPGPRRQAVIDALRAVVAPGGVLVSTERWPDEHHTLHWARTLASAGLAVDWNRSTMIDILARPPHPRERFPLLVAQQQQGRASCPASRVLALHAANKDDSVLLGAPAELLFLAIAPRTLIASQEIHHPDGVERRELWEARRVLLVWITTNLGHRRLELWPVEQSEAARARIHGSR